MKTKPEKTKGEFPVSEPFSPRTAWTPEWHGCQLTNEEDMRIRTGDAYEPDDDEISDALIERLHRRGDSQPA